MNRHRTIGVCYERGVQEIFDETAPVSPPMSRRVLGAVAIGGAIGAAGRWGVAEAMGAFGAHHPGAWGWATLIVNVVGSLMIGFAARQLDRNTVAWAFVVTGVLGGFTTFSALAVEINDLADAGRMPLAIGYGAITLATGIAAVALAQGRPGDPRVVSEAAT